MFFDIARIRTEKDGEKKKVKMKGTAP